MADRHSHADVTPRAALRTPPGFAGIRVLAVAYAAALVAGCAGGALPKAAEDAIASASDAGATAVDARATARGLRWDVVSGAKGNTPAQCDGALARTVVEGRATVTGCGMRPDAPIAALAQALDAAALAAARQAPHAGVDSVQVWWIPPGTSHRVTSAGEGDPRALRFALVMRDAGPLPHRADERRVVRAFAHEFLHLADAVHGELPQDVAEYRATMAESCIELEAFGSTVGYESQDDFNVPTDDYARTLPRFARISLQQRARASADLQRFLTAQLDGAKGPVTPERGGTALRDYCRALFSSRIALPPPGTPATR